MNEDKTLLDFMVENDMRITNGDRWLIVESDSRGYNFTVYQRPYKAKNTRTLKVTRYLESALATLKTGVV